jgi:hypothetical protein
MSPKQQQENYYSVLVDLLESNGIPHAHNADGSVSIRGQRRVSETMHVAATVTDLRLVLDSAWRVG